MPRRSKHKPAPEPVKPEAHAKPDSPLVAATKELDHLQRVSVPTARAGVIAAEALLKAAIEGVQEAKGKYDNAVEKAKSKGEEVRKLSYLFPAV